MNYRDTFIGFVFGVIVSFVVVLMWPAKAPLPYSVPGGGPTVFPGGGTGIGDPKGGTGVSDPVKGGVSNPSFTSPGGPSFSAPTVDKK